MGVPHDITNVGVLFESTPQVKDTISYFKDVCYLKSRIPESALLSMLSSSQGNASN